MENMTATATKPLENKSKNQPGQGNNNSQNVVAKEDESTKAIESVTAKIPSDAYLAAAIGAMSVSLGFMVAKQKHISLFFGQWVAPFLLFGIYNKLVKQLGHEGEKV